MELDPLHLTGGRILHLPVGVPGQGRRDQRAGQGQGGQARGLAKHQQRTGRHHHGGVTAHQELIVIGQRNPLADRSQHRARLIDTRARRAQGVEAEQDVGGAGESAGGGAQRRQHALVHGHGTSMRVGEAVVIRTVRRSHGGTETIIHLGHP